jgi:hypothetical protein
MMANNYIGECPDPGPRGGTRLEVECFEGVQDYKKFEALV